MEKTNFIGKNGVNYANCGIRVHVSNMDLKQRETWVFIQFNNYAKNQAQYLYKKHNFTLSECISYISSGLYFKFMELREKTIMNSEHRYNTIEYDTYRYTMSLLRKVTNNLNFSACGSVITGIKTNSFNMAIDKNKDSEKNYFFEAINIKPRLTEIDTKHYKKVDIVDVLEQWQNRSNLKELREQKALDLLNSEYISLNNSDIEKNTTDLQIEKKSILIHELCTLNGSYRTPEEDYFYNLKMLEVKNTIQFINKNTKGINDIKKALHHFESNNLYNGVIPLDNKEKQCIKNFKRKYHLDSITTSELVTLFN